MQLDELTQQNAALVEAGFGGKPVDGEQARGLKESMARYEVDEEQLADMLLRGSPRWRGALRRFAVRQRITKNFRTENFSAVDTREIHQQR